MTWLNAEDIQPGDIFWDHGGGVVGFLIRHYSHNPYAHVGVVVGKTHAGELITHEAYPGGLRQKYRKPETIRRISRVWRNQFEQDAILYKSHVLLGAKYAYGELLRIIAARLWKNSLMLVIFYWLAFLAGLQATATLIAIVMITAFIMKDAKDGPRVICSNHVAQCIREARPNVALSYEPHAIWPGRLEQDVSRIEWQDRV